LSYLLIVCFVGRVKSKRRAKKSRIVWGKRRNSIFSAKKQGEKDYFFYFPEKMSELQFQKLDKN